MERIVKQTHFLGTMKLLDLTRDMAIEDRDEILKYIAHLEASQLYLAKKLTMFWDDVTIPVQEQKKCYYCHGQNCSRCKQEKDNA